MKNKFRGRHGFNNNQNRGQRARRNEKPLDPSLFIRHAVENFVPNEPELSGVKFSEYNLVEKLQRNITEHGYVSPTAIQAKTIPDMLAGRDVIGMANTGTGKTAAFLIPLINKVVNNRDQRVLIIVPTRELATQIKDEFKIFARGLEIEAIDAVGGVAIKRQIYGLRHKPHFVIGTPGRLKDLIQNHELNLQLFQNIVLDEVDRMVDIGFIHDIKSIVSMLPRVRQSSFLNALSAFCL